MKRRIKQFYRFQREKFIFLLNKVFNNGKLLLIVHQSRSGSTLLGNVLSQSEDIEYYGEVYNNYPKRLMRYYYFKKYLLKPKEIIGNMKFLSNKKWTGIEIIPWQQFNSHNLSWLYNDENILKIVNVAEKTIYLQRKNKLNLLVSLLIANKYNLYHSSINSKTIEQNKERKSIYINVNNPVMGFSGSLLDIIDYLVKEDNVWIDKIKKLGGWVITYEDDLSSGVINPSVDLIVKNLKIKSFEFNIMNRKLSKKSLNNIISNYSEVQDYLKNSEYLWMLKD